MFLFLNSKIESNWSEHVHPEQGDLFYIDIDGKSRARSNSLPHPHIHPPPSPQHEKKGGLSRQNGGRHSDSAVATSRLLRGSGSEEDEEDKLRSRAELRKKSEQLQQALRKKQDQPRNGEVRSSGRWRRAKAKDAPSNSAFLQQNNSKLLLSHGAEKSEMTKKRQSLTQKDNGAIQQQTNGRQLKDVLLVPDFSRHTDSSSNKANGAELFELLLGIVLCRYKQRPGVAGGGGGGAVNGEVGEALKENKERKLVVQGVVTGSAADKSGNVHRGKNTLSGAGFCGIMMVTFHIHKKFNFNFKIP